MTEKDWRSEEDYERIPGPIEFLGAAHPEEESAKQADKEDLGIVPGPIPPSEDSGEDSEEGEQRDPEETNRSISRACPWEFD